METHNNLEPFKHPVEPNDKQPGKEPITVVLVGTGIVQPLNPNANAIKIVKKRIEFLKLCIGADMGSRISECIDILKLLQS